MKEVQNCLSGLLITFSKREILLFCFSHPVTISKINIFLLSFQGKNKEHEKYLFGTLVLVVFCCPKSQGKTSISYHIAANGII